MNMSEDCAAFFGVMALTVTGVLLVAPPLCRLVGILLQKHAAGMDAAYRAYREEWDNGLRKGTIER